MVAGVAEGDTLVTIYEQVALDEGVGRAGPEEDGGGGNLVGGADAPPLVVAYRPAVGVVGADVAGVIFGRGGGVFQVGAGEQAIITAIADAACPEHRRRVNFDQLITGIQAVQVVEDGAVAAVDGDVVFVAVAQCEVGNGNVVGEDGDDVGIGPGEHLAAIEDDVVPVAGSTANGQVVDGDVDGVLQGVDSRGDEDGGAGRWWEWWAVRGVGLGDGRCPNCRRGHGGCAEGADRQHTTGQSGAMSANRRDKKCGLFMGCPQGEFQDKTSWGVTPIRRL